MHIEKRIEPGREPGYKYIRVIGPENVFVLLDNMWSIYGYEEDNKAGRA